MTTSSQAVDHGLLEAIRCSSGVEVVNSESESDRLSEYRRQDTNNFSSIRYLEWMSFGLSKAQRESVSYLD